MRLRNLYNPPTLKDWPASIPWTSDDSGACAVTPAGWQVSVTGTITGWLFPPAIDDTCRVVYEDSDGGMHRTLENNTIAVNPGEPATYSRIGGYADGTLEVLSGADLPLVFAASDNPY